MHRYRLLLPLVLVLGLVAAACSAQGASPTATTGSPSNDTSSATSPTTGSSGTCPTAPDASTASTWAGTSAGASLLPTIVSSETICGQNRFLFGFIDRSSNTPVGSPDRTAKVAFYDLGRDPSKPTTTADGKFIWAIQGQRGLYVAPVTFPEAGVWGAEFTTSAPGKNPETIRLVFEVAPTGSSIPVGGKAPASKTPTLADVGGDVHQVSTDTNPDPSFYKTSVDQAVAQHKPFVLVFATPAFCTSRQCGPTLDVVKSVAKGEPGVTFINVEPYKLNFENGHLQPILDANGQLVPTDATTQWGLVSEPWIFVVDRDGIVRGSFEGVVGTDELKASVDSVR